MSARRQDAVNERGDRHTTKTIYNRKLKPKLPTEPQPPTAQLANSTAEPRTNNTAGVGRLGRLVSLLVGLLEDVDRAVLEEDLGGVLARLGLVVGDRVGSLNGDERADKMKRCVSVA